MWPCAFIISIVPLATCCHKVNKQAGFAKVKLFWEIAFYLWIPNSFGVCTAFYCLVTCQEAFCFGPHQGQHFFFFTKLQRAQFEYLYISFVYNVQIFLCRHCSGTSTAFIFVFMCCVYMLCCNILCSIILLNICSLSTVVWPLTLAGMLYLLRTVLFLAPSLGTDQFVPTSKALSWKLFTNCLRCSFVCFFTSWFLFALQVVFFSKSCATAQRFSQVLQNSKALNLPL